MDAVSRMSDKDRKLQLPPALKAIVTKYENTYYGALAKS